MMNNMKRNKEVTENIELNSNSLNNKELNNKKWKKFFNVKNATLTLKILMTVVTLVLLFVFFNTKAMYLDVATNEILYTERIFAVVVLSMIEIALIWVKNILKTIPNAIVTILTCGFSILGIFALLEYSQGFEILRLSMFDLKYNLFIIFAVMVFFFVITNSFRFSMMFTSIFACVVGLVNYYLIQFRGTGLLASDIYNVGTAMNVAGGYSYELSYNCFILVLLTVMICTFACKLKKFTLFKKFLRLIPLVCGVAIIAFTINRTVFDEAYYQTWKIKMFKPQVSYEKHGCALMFTHSFRFNIIEKPEGYSVEKAEDIASKYTGVAQTTEKKPNIIVIMDEAFSDITGIGEFQLSQDALPFYHSLKDNTVKGKLFVSVCAGGTANTEFEVLTSNAMAFTPVKSSPYQTYINSEMSSLASILKKQDYSGITAMHPYRPNGYKRDKVYPLLGFNDFISESSFPDAKRIRNFISDEADFDRIIKEYEEAKKNSDAPYFMFNVTMQNHSDYVKVWDNMNMDITLSGDIANTKSSIYVNLVKETDKALEKLITYFKNVDEPTLILFFGDHQPRLGSNFYKKVLKTSPLDKEYEELYNYFTDFVIWANYDIEEKQDVWVSANYLAPMLLDVAGVEQTGYQQYVSQVMEEVPVLTQLGYIGKDGKFYQTEDKTSPYYELLNEYNILQYNNLFDSKHRIDGFFEIK